LQPSLAQREDHVKVAVFFNDDAGSQAAASDVRRDIERHGHDVVGIVDPEAGVPALFELDAELIVAAGGDGTVASVAREMAGRDVPLAVLPLGTANNIALSLGCDGPLDALIDHWAHARVRHADVGVARGPWGERRFIEGAGGGLVARSIAAIDAQPLDLTHTPEERLELALGGYLNVVSRLTAAPWTMHIDGERVDEECLLVEFLNIKSIGPNFVVSNDADPFDGSLTVALATEAHRDDLVAYWQARMANDATSLGLTIRKATSIVIEHGDDLHVDDALFAWPKEGSVELQIEHGVLPVLTGPFTV
jgi:diacylglycerol kinase family enzyme